MIREPWPRGRQRDGGIDEVPLAHRKGKLWLCGKHLVGPDPQAALDRVQATMVVCLTESHEISERYPQYVTWLDQHRGDRALWFPIPDLHAPRQAVAEEFLHRLDGLLAAGSQIIMHCAAGIGRSGTMAAAVLIWGGTPADSALKIVAAARPMAGPEAGPQRDFLADIARSAGRTTGGPTLQI